MRRQKKEISEKEISEKMRKDNGKRSICKSRVSDRG